MADKDGGALPQYRIDVGLIQKHGDPDKPVWGSDPQLLLLPIAGRRRSFNAEDCTARTPDHGAACYHRCYCLI
jgi:hypothetical protein